MRSESRRIEELVKIYLSHHAQIGLFREQLLSALSSSAKLGDLVHSIRSRLKDPEHLRDKLRRKLAECKDAGTDFDIRPDDLLLKVNDLVGVRILHLHTRQIQKIDAVLREILDYNRYKLIEGPCARTWDDESRSFFQECKIETQVSPSLYTSVHYVIESASRTKITAEIQVRTLMEEVWGEVDHRINYPHPTESLACREQLKVLARVTSSATRLVAAIFPTRNDHAERKNVARATRLRRPTRP
jgi:ppGpp synthetase/RelA/SpoT-type nucleotidyltranferase